jgi:hypothetical protein
MATKAIQASGGDYATVALWEAYLEGIGTLAADEIGQINAEELSTVAGVTFNGTIIIPGVFHVILEAQTNDSFRDGPNQLTTALRYGAQSRARWTHSGSDPMITSDVTNFTIRNLMLNKDNNYGRGLHFTDAAATGCNLENVILQGQTIDAALLDARSMAVRNCVLIDNGNDSANPAILGSSGTIDVVNSVIARTTTAGSNRIGILQAYATLTVVNTAIVGFPTDASGTIGGTNNATDKATGGLPATNRQNSLVGATEFESITNGSEDFRLKSTSAKCKDNGTASGSPTPPSTDIVGQARSGSTDIGVWELQAGGGAAAASERFIGGGFWY